MVKQAGLSRLEHITVNVDIEHQRRGDLEILIESPHNVTSQLAARRRFDLSAEGFANWTFMTVKHWLVYRFWVGWIGSIELQC
jgi:kexin